MKKVEERHPNEGRTMSNAIQNGRLARGQRLRASSRRGFTLIELLVAIAILGILGTVVIREIWGAIDEAKQTTATTKVKEIETQVQRYKTKHNKLPQDLMELTRPDDMNNGDVWLSEDALIDPWGNQIDMKVDDKGQFEIISYGEGGQADGFDLSLGKARDIGSRHIAEASGANKK